MASSPLRQILEDRVTQLLAEADRLVADSRQRAVRDCADRLNQAARRIGQAQSVAEWGAALVDSTSAFATGAALFGVEGDIARLEKVRGVSTEELPAPAEIPLALAPALAGAIETGEPVVAAAVPGEISSALAVWLGPAPDLRVTLLPITVGKRVRGILCAWGTVEQSALELLAQVAAAARSALDAPPATSSVPLVNILAADSVAGSGATADAAPPRALPTWEELTPAEQQIHLRAQRFARVQVAQMRLVEAEAVQSGRGRSDLYARLRDSIDAARREFREKFFATCPGMLDYLHLELVRTLGHDDAQLLGPDYPGPMV